MCKVVINCVLNKENYEKCQVCYGNRVCFRVRVYVSGTVEPKRSSSDSVYINTPRRDIVKTSAEDTVNMKTTGCLAIFVVVLVIGASYVQR